MTCFADDSLRDIVERNKEPYDFLPVIGPGSNGVERVVGLLHAATVHTQFKLSDTVREHFASLSEEHLIGADASILEFVRDADQKPCRLVVAGASIVGLVSLSDLQRLPVRAALFALITGFEITMSEAIRRECPEQDEWFHYLTKGRQDKIAKEIVTSKRDDGFVDALLFTQFCDKVEIVVEALQLSASKTTLRDQLKDIQDLRDNLAHANEYAASPPHARKVCAVVRNLLARRAEIAVAGTRTAK